VRRVRTGLNRSSNTTGDVGIRLLDELTTVVSHAAAAILAARGRPLDPRTKSDQSPVTAADEAAEAVILEGVSKLLPGAPIVSEEAAHGATTARLDAGDFVLVDPLDGTRELLAGRDEFTVNLALVSGGRPVLGIIAAPALGLIWRATDGKGAERLRLAPGAPAIAGHERMALRTRPLPPHGAIHAVVSRSHLDAATRDFLAKLPKVEQFASGSAIKFCRVAEGAADVYPRLASTSEWDVAAGHAVLVAAGGAVITPNGGPMTYGDIAKGFRNSGFIAWGDPSAPSQLTL